jgi:hypothetical protein
MNPSLAVNSTTMKTALRHARSIRTGSSLLWIALFFRARHGIEPSIFRFLRIGVSVTFIESQFLLFLDYARRWDRDGLRKRAVRKAVWRADCVLRHLERDIQRDLNGPAFREQLAITIGGAETEVEQALGGGRRSVRKLAHDSGAESVRGLFESAETRCRHALRVAREVYLE